MFAPVQFPVPGVLGGHWKILRGEPRTPLQAAPDGHIQLGLTTQRAIIEAQRREIAALTNGHEPEVVEAVVEGAEN